MKNGEGSGFWNRAGRKSGGPRTPIFATPRTCACGAEPMQWETRIVARNPDGSYREVTHCKKCARTISDTGAAS